MSLVAEINLIAEIKLVMMRLVIMNLETMRLQKRKIIEKCLNLKKR